MAEVFVIDRVVTAPGCAQAFIDAYLADYAPGAGERGLALRDVLVSPPIWFDDRSNVVTITWSVPSAEAWWEMTRQGRPDLSVARFWDGTADLVVERNRSFATAAGDVNPDDTAPISQAPAPMDLSVANVGMTRLIDVDESERRRVLTSLRQAAASSGAVRFVVEPTLPGSRNGGDILAHLRFPSENALEESAFDESLTDPAITQINGVTYRGTPVRRSTGSVYRALLLRVAPSVDPAAVTDFEQELATMPRYVSTIAAWQLSRVDAAVGASVWTHVFEQEFTSVDGLIGPYLMHPIHWAVVDRWFDPETTDVIVRDRICHSFCELPAPIL